MNDWAERLGRLTGTEGMAEVAARYASLPEAMAHADHIGGTAGEVLRVVRAAALASLMPRATEGQLICDWRAFENFVTARLRWDRAEVALVIYLDRKNRVIRTTEASGTVDHCPVYVREIAREALMCDACAVMVAHNHPSGDPEPSRADIAMSKSLQEALGVFQIALHDSLIVGAGRNVSLRAYGLL